jgi:hypothetical protein
MGNLFLDLPLPVTNGPGVAVDTSAMGNPKTITVLGSFAGATITVEGSTDGGVVFAPVCPSFQNHGGKRVVNVAAEFMRVRVSGRRAGVQFTANCDIGANDIGGLFGAIPIPAGDGPGLPLNVSTFGSFATFVIGGNFPGQTVLVEVSEDGSSWAALTAFAGQGGLQSMEVTGNFVRVNVSGRRPTLPFTATASVGAVNDPTSGGAGSPMSCCLEYAPGSGATGPVVWDDWDDLYAQLQAMRAAAPDGGCYEILFNEQFAAVVVPATQIYDMTQTTWVGRSEPVPVVSGLVTVTLAGDCVIEGLREIKHLLLQSLPGLSVVAPIADIGQGDIFYLTDHAVIAGNNPVIEVNPGGPFKTSTIMLRHGSQIVTGDHVVVSGPDDGTLIIDVDKTSDLFNDTVSGGAHVLLVRLEGQRTQGLSAATNQSAFLGAITAFYNPCPYTLALFPTVLRIGTVNQVDPSAAPIAVTLPDVVDVAPGSFVIVKNITASINAITITPGAGDTIDLAATLVLVTGFGFVTLVSDGISNWMPISRG